MSNNLVSKSIRSISQNIVCTVICRRFAMLTEVPCFQGMKSEKQKMRTNKKGTSPLDFPRKRMTDLTICFRSSASYTPGINNKLFLMHFEWMLFYLLNLRVYPSTLFCIVKNGQGWRKTSSEQSIWWIEMDFCLWIFLAHMSRQTQHQEGT